MLRATLREPRIVKGPAYCRVTLLLAAVLLLSGVAGVALGSRVLEARMTGGSLLVGGFIAVPLGLTLLLESSPKRSLLFRVAGIAGGLVLATLGATTPALGPLEWWEEPTPTETRVLLVVGGLGLAMLALVSGLQPRQRPPADPNPHRPRARVKELLERHRTALILSVTSAVLLTAAWAAAVVLVGGEVLDQTVDLARSAAVAGAALVTLASSGLRRTLGVVVGLLLAAGACWLAVESIEAWSLRDRGELLGLAAVVAAAAVALLAPVLASRRDRRRGHLALERWTHKPHLAVAAATLIAVGLVAALDVDRTRCVRATTVTLGWLSEILGVPLMSDVGRGTWPQLTRAYRWSGFDQSAWLREMWEDPQFDPVIRIPELGLTLVTPPGEDPNAYFADYENVNQGAERLTSSSADGDGLLLLQSGAGSGGGMGAQLSLTRGGRLTVRHRTSRWEEPDEEPWIEVLTAELDKPFVEEVFRLAMEARLAERSFFEADCRSLDGGVITLAMVEGGRAGRARFINSRPPSPELRPLTRQLVFLGVTYGVLPEEYLAWVERF